jgi:phage terminase small subunit
MQQHELALKDYILGMKYKDIAEKCNVSISTVKQWKFRYKWERDKPVKKPKKTVDNVDKNEKVYKKSTEAEISEVKDEELSDQEQLFCYHYVRTWNATQAALKAGYAAESKNKHSAQVLGCRLLQRSRVRLEVNRLRELFKQEIHVDIQDFLSFCLKVVGADIGDYLKFGAIDRLVYDSDGPVKDEETGEYLKEPVNSIELGESEQLDTSVIQEIKQGKDGISIKLADKKWAWEQLIKYFDWLPDTWQRAIEERKVAAAEKNSGKGVIDKDITIKVSVKDSED